MTKAKKGERGKNVLISRSQSCSWIHHKQYRYPWFPEDTEIILRREVLEYTTQDHTMPFSLMGEMKAIQRLHFEIQRGKVAIRNSEVLNLSSVISCKFCFYARGLYFKIITGVLAKGNRPTVATFFEVGYQWDQYMLKLIQYFACNTQHG